MQATIAPDIDHYWRTVAFNYCRGNGRYFECFMLKGFPLVFQITEQIHAVRGAGYRNSLGLLKQKTEGVIRSIQTRYEQRTYSDYDSLLDWKPDCGEVKYGEPREAKL